MTARIVAIAALLAACNGDKDANCDYVRPVAHAGDDMSLELDGEVTLSAGASTVACGYAPSYTWAFKDVPAASNIDGSDLEGLCFGSHIVNRCDEDHRDFRRLLISLQLLTKLKTITIG